MSHLKQLYIAWARYQRRPDSMKEEFGYNLVFVPLLPNRRGLSKAILSYPIQTLRTIALIIRHRPSVLWIQAPPNVLVHLAWLARLVCLGQIKLIADLHNSALSKRWFGVPLTRHLLNTFDVVLVHNEVTRSEAQALGVSFARLHVLEDKLPNFKVNETLEQPAGRPIFVVPCSFYEDEPVQNVIEAARHLSEFEFRITGSRARAAALGYTEHTPKNVVFTDFVSNEIYERLLADATGILCLTTEDGIQLSAASEAVAAAKPMIISDTPLLRSLFSRGYFVDNSAEALIAACRAVTCDYTRYAQDTMSLRSDEARYLRWQAQANAVTMVLSARR